MGIIVKAALGEIRRIIEKSMYDQNRRWLYGACYWENNIGATWRLHPHIIGSISTHSIRIDFNGHTISISHGKALGSGLTILACHDLAYTSTTDRVSYELADPKFFEKVSAAINKFMFNIERKESMFWVDNLDLKWRYPDKMPECTPEKLLSFEQKGGYVAQQKLDGYRLIVMGDESQVACVSRHRKPMPVSQDILNRFFELELPKPWMLDCEWVKLRTMTPETVYILDSLYIGGEWMGQKNLLERQKPYLRDDFGDGLPSQIKVPDEVDRDFIEFMIDQITDGNPKEAISEGIVLKKINAPLIGDRKTSVKNPAWAKCKWRAGEGGDTAVLTVEKLLEIREGATK